MNRPNEHLSFQQTLTPASLAVNILKGFEKSYRQFCLITKDSKTRFENQDWAGVQLANKERLQSYEHMISMLSSKLYSQLDSPKISTALWQQTKSYYSRLLTGHPQAQQAETFFNSTFSRLFRRQGINPQHLYIQSMIATPITYDVGELCYNFPIGGIVSTCIESILYKYRFSSQWRSLSTDVTAIRKQLTPLIKKHCFRHIELIQHVFYRNKGAYLIGRLKGKHQLPIVFALLNDENGELYVDAVLTQRDDLSILFGFARAYFMVNGKATSQIIAYLHELMPSKPRYELWSALGLVKHSKTEFYRQHLAHLEQTSDQFEIADGIKGMVMAVFTLPSSDTVFKIIKDEFAPPKRVTHQIVKDRYKLVKEHDRVGRMADTQEFSNFHFPRQRISAALLDELKKVASSQLVITDEHIIVKHLYTERRMIPLNIFLRQANPTQVNNAVDEYGNAIKQLAAANIFPGDMLFKNFGVTRHGRVIFYDYDEIWHMHQCNFRTIPKPETYEQMIASEPWYRVGEFDVFPEEFAHFMLGQSRVKRSFMKLHPELLLANYWRQLQENFNRGIYADVYPYRKDKRLFHK
ncbi:MAG: bifunctional isocitrate dehydrogenase kinase/phosphatase [Psychrobium sp.]